MISPLCFVYTQQYLIKTDRIFTEFRFTKARKTAKKLWVGANLNKKYTRIHQAVTENALTQLMEIIDKVLCNTICVSIFFLYFFFLVSSTKKNTKETIHRPDKPKAIQTTERPVIIPLYQRKTNLTNTVRLIRASLDASDNPVKTSNQTILNVLKQATIKEAGQKHCVDNIFNDAYECQQDLNHIIDILFAKSTENHNV